MDSMLMAKKKKAAPLRDVSARATTVAVRASTAWKEWLGRFAEAQRKDVSDLIDEALLRMARAEGFEMPPKR